LTRAFRLGSGLGAVFLLGLPIQAQVSIGTTPAWLKNLGDGSGGAYSCTSGKCTLAEEQWVSSFTVSAGATVQSGGNGPIIIRATGTCNVAGTIANSPNFASGQGVSGAGDFGGGGGGGGGGAAAGRFGLSTVGNGGSPLVPGGLPGAAGGGPGGPGATTVPAQYRPLLSGGTFWPVGGSRGGQGGSGGPLGGQGGGVVILVCHTINFTGTIDVSGAPGIGASANSTGASGGGASGYVILSALSYTANSGSINLAGGPGGSCNGHSVCGPGGSGGSGFTIAISIQ
jgi:hypothetical protein